MSRAAKVIVSPVLTGRHVVVAEWSGEVLDDAQGRGYKTAHDAYLAYSYKSVAPKKRDVVKQKVKKWCADHEAFMGDVGTMYAMPGGESVLKTDVERLLFEHGVFELPFTVRDLMRHW